MKNILVTVDFSDNEKIIIDHAVKLAKAFEAKLWLIHIVAPDPDFVGFDIGPQYIRDSRASEIKEEHKEIQRYTRKLQSQYVNAEGLLIQGATIEMILEEAKKLNIDLIIAGHHDHNFLYKAFVGSVSTQIMKKSKIPIMIIPIE